MPNPSGVSRLMTFTFTLLALTAFAANSVLCRMALGEHEIDAASFTLIRLSAGAAVLTIILSFGSGKSKTGVRGNWHAGFMLFLYAITFSYAYITLTTGTGALILFGWVQLTMIVATLITGNRLHFSEWLGVVLAFAGFVYLVLPAVSTPSLNGFIYMTIAGIAWGLYTLKGRGSQTPLSDTTWNFIRSLPLLLLVVVPILLHGHISAKGFFLAVLSGSLASGVGYAVWYSALTGLSTSQAAVVQLLVPVIAAVGGVVLVSEPITQRLLVSSAMILGGILLVVLGRYMLAKDSIS